MEKMKEEEEQQHPAAAEILSRAGSQVQQQAGYRTGKVEDEQPERLWTDLLPKIHREILSRVPYRSLCRFRCVSKAWLALCSDPAVRRRSPQTLSGFFCYSQLDVGGGQSREGLSFLNLSGWGRPLVDDPSLRFVRG
ncbi:uncharacterized protein [Triticum aestivum]|uniref:uncharacterized protein isoform X2 n=1 Tax=Triticum aestivum TaxID=4565 RepID=UPI001D00FEA2|nr:uncharacterized protein LOC123182794 isoform X2 [Triticum aestivum]